MVNQRKTNPSFIAKNLLVLRSRKGLTLEQMAKELDLQGKTSYYPYEQGKVVPDIFKLLKLASFFDVSVEELVNKDLELVPNNQKLISTALYKVEKVPVVAKAGYTVGFGQPEWINNLPSIKIPYKPYGIARAFEIDGDSMEPEIENGSTVVAIKVDGTDLKDRKTYIIVTNEGIQCKDVRVGDDVIYLISKNNKYLPKHIEKSEVKELWEVWKKIKPGETWESPGFEE